MCGRGEEIIIVEVEKFDFCEMVDDEFIEDENWVGSDGKGVCDFVGFYFNRIVGGRRGIGNGWVIGWRRSYCCVVFSVCCCIVGVGVGWSEEVFEYWSFGWWVRDIV